MTPHIRDLFDVDRLNKHLADGHVREQTHPHLPLRILNYTERTAYERVWTDVTRRCRGLIVDAAGLVVARPFEKFFNHGEAEAGALDMAAKTIVVDKVDGSLGIIHRAGADWAVATRGSFTSEQAIHGTQVLRTRYAGFRPPDGVTVLCEIVFPGNRIVCDYGDLDDLVLLGAVDIATGTVMGPHEVAGWPGPRAQTFEAPTLADALAIPPRAGAEGLVVRMVDTGAMIKIKQPDYVALHRIVTGLNARVVWEQLGDGKSVAEICEPLPDEFHDWVWQVRNGLMDAASAILTTARHEHEQILASLPDGWARKDYAALARSENRAWLFMLLDGKDPAPKIWRTLCPSGDDRPINITEDAA
jgi:RNA ligase